MVKYWLNFSRSERYGVAVLALILLLVVACPYIYKTVFFEPSGSLSPYRHQQIDSFFSSLRPLEYEPTERHSVAAEESPPKAGPENFPFDPNTATIADFMRLGFTERQAAAIERFRSRGARFRSPDDFARVYVVDSVIFRRLKPFISIPPADHPWQRQTVIYDSIRQACENLVVELNTADTLELVKLKGIGRGYARRIVHFRSQLGGYFSIDQLTDIYGISPEVVERIRPHVRVDTLRTRRLNLNMISYSELRMHPYLNDHQARAIVYYREKRGNFNRVDELLEYKLLDTRTYEKVRRYFVLN